MSKINPHLVKVLDNEVYKLKPLEYYVTGIIKNKDVNVLAESITLLESESRRHQLMASDILKHVYSADRQSLRMGITGAPGVGKSTFIDVFGSRWLEDGDKLAVLTIDPSSSVDMGSVLGDKTRMSELVSRKNIFIRPSPSRNFLGGTNRFTFEAILMCEAAGFNRIIVETVGTGQSEIEITNMVDIVLMLLLPGGGDDMQGIKKGVLEIADFIIVHKADGDQLSTARETIKAYHQALHLRQSQAVIQTFSSITLDGLQELKDNLSRLFKDKSNSGDWSDRRQGQLDVWFKQSLLRFLSENLARELNQYPAFVEAIQQNKLHPSGLMTQYQRLISLLKVNISE